MANQVIFFCWAFGFSTKASNKAFNEYCFASQMSALFIQSCGEI